MESICHLSARVPVNRHVCTLYIIVTESKEKESKQKTQRAQRLPATQVATFDSRIRWSWGGCMCSQTHSTAISCERDTRAHARYTATYTATRTDTVTRTQRYVYTLCIRRIDQGTMRVGRKGEEEEEREGTRSIAMTLLLLLSVFSLRLSRAKFYYGFTVDCDSVRLFCGSSREWNSLRKGDQHWEPRYVF